MKPTTSIEPMTPRRLRTAASLLTLACLLAACASPSHRAPVEDRRPVTGTGRAAVPASPSAASATAPVTISSAR